MLQCNVAVEPGSKRAHAFIILVPLAAFTSIIEKKNLVRDDIIVQGLLS